MLVIRSVNLETDAETVSERPAVRPPLEAEQRRALEAAVAEAHPHARPRSFAGGVASFLGHRLLVVARYRAAPATPRRPEPAERVDQASLFAG